MESTKADFHPEPTGILGQVKSASLDAAVNRCCPEFQFMASVPFTDSQGKPSTTTAYLWIPEKCRKVRGLFLAQQDVAAQGMMENAIIRQACRDTDMAIVWFYPWFAAAFDKPDLDGAVLQTALNELSAVSGYEEIAKSPWLVFGHSSMTAFAQRLANWKPERCIAQIDFKGGADFTLPNNRQVPLFVLDGQFTEWGQQKRDWGSTTPNFWFPSAIAKDRAVTQRPLSWMLECGSSHFVMTDTEADLIAMYIRKAAAARLPSEAGEGLQPVDIESGWVVDLDMTHTNRSPAQPLKMAKGNARNGVWFFDGEMARAVEKVMSVNWNRKTQIPVILKPDGSIPVVQENGLFEGVSPVTEEDGVTLKFKTTFLDKIPDNFTTGAGHPLGHSDKGPIQIGRLSGNGIVSGNGIRMIFDRRRTIFSSMIFVRHPGDDEYRPSIQPFNVGSPYNKSGSAQKITFPPIPDQASGAKGVELQATSDTGLPVDYYVIVGPATVSGKWLTFTGIPPRSRFPIKVTVMAYQYGRSMEPAVRTAQPVEQSFMIF